MFLSALYGRRWKLIETISNGTVSIQILEMSVYSSVENLLRIPQWEVQRKPALD